MAMTTQRRRYFLGLLNRKQEMLEAERERLREEQASKGSGGRGTKTTKVSGENLKSMIKSNKLPEI